MNLFKDKYRVPSARAAFWDYGWPGAYFITICTSKRTPFFGEITHHDKGFDHFITPIGEIAIEEWLKTTSLRTDIEVMLGDYVVMPDHFHGILIIGKGSDDNKSERQNGLCEIQSNNVPSIIRGSRQQ